jgi:uncharacterized membrane protein
MSPGAPSSPAKPAPRPPLLSTYKSVFLSGLGALLPTILTLWVLVACYSFIDRNAATPISDLLKDRVILGTDEGLRFARWLWDLPLALPTPAAQQHERSPAQVEEDRARHEAFKDAVYRRFPNWLGFFIAALIIFVVGFFVASFIGRTIWELIESWILKIPIIKSIYPSTKQMVDFLFTSDESGPNFNAVVAVEYPVKGQWSLGFITGQGRPEILAHANREFVTVFIPMAPTPVTGFVVFVPKDECIQVAMTVDEAFKFYISGGVIGSTQAPANTLTSPNAASLPSPKQDP